MIDTRVARWRRTAAVLTVLLFGSCVIASGIARADEPGSADAAPRGPIALLHTAPEDASDTLLGYAVAVAGDIVAAAAPHAPVEGHANAGAVHLFDARTGRLVRTLLSPAPTAGETFGFDVAMDRTHVLVGAPRATVDRKELAGAAYLFDVETGSLVRRFVEPTPTAQHEFGYAVGLDRGLAAIGSPRSPARSVGAAGLVYVFTTDDGALRHRLATLAPRTGEGFAQTLDLTGRALAVGAPYASVGDLEKAGAVDVFDAPTGRWLNRLHAPAPRAGVHFGAAVDIQGRTILVGAPHPAAARSAGRAHLLETRTGRIRHVFRAPAQTDVRELFGHAVARRGNVVLIGAPDAPYGKQPKAGAAYVFDAASGALRGARREPTPTPESQYGIAVALTRGAAVVGAQRAQRTPGGGAVYVHPHPGTR